MSFLNYDFSQFFKGIIRRGEMNTPDVHGREKKGKRWGKKDREGEGKIRR